MCRSKFHHDEGEWNLKFHFKDWSEKGVSYLNCMCVYDIMMDVDEALQTCDTILDEIDLGIDYTSREKDIDRLLEGHGTLHRYIDVLNCYVDDKLDQPLKKDFKKNATETISRIHLEDFEVDITLGLTENNYITGGMGYAGTMVEQEKAKLTFADFIGTSDGKADGNGFHMAYTNGSVEDFASIFAAQYEAMKASGALGEDNNLTQQEFLEQFYRQGEFTHDSSNPFLNFVSSVLDITIIKPVIEACTGEDLITGEDLTDMERGLKVVFAVVDLVTLGGAIAATKFSEMGLKEGLKAFGKTALIDFAGNTAACGVGALGETFDWPVPITMMLSLAAGITVSISGNKLLFKNADGIEIGSKTLSDDDLKIVEQTIEGENYSNLTEVVSAKEAEVYLHFLESGSTEGMTESELKAVQKIEELIKSNKIDYDGILKIRNETVKSDVEVVRNTTEDSVEDVGKSAAEDAGKVVESGTDSWNMVEGGGTINGREYSQHAMERMAPDTPQVRAELSRRAEKSATQRGLKVGTQEYYEYCKKYVDPRNIPPSVIEDAISSTKGIPGNRPDTFIHETADVKIVINSAGKVITVIPK